MPRFLVVAVLVLIAACGGQSSSSTTSSPIAETTSTAHSETPTTQPATTTTAQVTTTTAPEYDFVLEGGTEEVPEIVVHGPERVSVAPGDEVQLTVFSSVDGDLHVHGYDLHFALVAGDVTEVSFTADVPGIFEAELEESHQLIFELEVAP